MWAALAIATKDIVLCRKKDGDDKRWVVQIIEAGSEITITKGIAGNFFLWSGSVWTLDKEYVGEVIHVYSKD